MSHDRAMQQGETALKEGAKSFWPPFSLRIFETAEEMVDAAVVSFLEVVEDSPARVALPTGRTFVPFYKNLAQRCRLDSHLNLGSASGFNLDELVLPKEHAKTFAAYMQRHVWSQTTLDKDRFHIPDVGLMMPSGGEAGGSSDATLEQICKAYDRTMAEFQPLDMALLGVGADGHVGYNLPGPAHSETHAVELSESLAEELQVPADLRPLRAVTMGFAPLQAARRVLLLASGASKAEAMRRLIYGPRDPLWPCTLLRDHAGFEVYMDRDALGGLVFDPARGFPSDGNRSEGEKVE